MRRTAVKLRRDFDAAFAEPALQEEAGHVDLLLIASGGARYALRLAEIAAITADPKITAVPAAAPALLGLAFAGGSLVAVYDLAAVIGHQPAAAPRWLALAAGSTPVALAFDHLEGHRRLRSDEAGDVVTLDSGPRPVISVPFVLDSIAARPADSGNKETA